MCKTTSFDQNPAHFSTLDKTGTGIGIRRVGSPTSSCLLSCVSWSIRTCAARPEALLGEDRIKLGDDVVANDRHVESTCDRIAPLGTQGPSQVSEIQRLVDGTGLRKHQSLALLLQLLCLRFQRFTADAYALIVGPADIGSMCAPDRRGPPCDVALVEHSEQVRFHQAAHRVVHHVLLPQIISWDPNRGARFTSVLSNSIVERAAGAVKVMSHSDRQRRLSAATLTPSTHTWSDVETRSCTP